MISSVDLACPTRGDYFLDSSFLSSSACRKCACTWAYLICGETSPSWLCRDEYQWVSGCASCICWTVVLRVSSRPTADVWNTRCNAEWWRHLLNQFKTSQVCRCSRWKNMEIWCQQSIPQEPPSHNHMYGLKMRDHNAMDFGCSRNCHIWVKCNRYNCHELRLGLQSRSSFTSTFTWNSIEFVEFVYLMIWCCYIVWWLLIATEILQNAPRCSQQSGKPAWHSMCHGPTTRRHDEETSLQRIRWILFAPKLSCWKLAKRFFASRNVSIFKTCLKQKVILSYNCENQVENISFKGN